MNEKNILEINSEFGFRHGDIGTHTSRTIMLEELGALLDNCSPDSKREDYIIAIIENNCLGKRTVATRKLSCQRLSELYGLDPEVILFRVMRQLWYIDQWGKPILAMLLALARDPLLLATVPPILRMHPGEELSRQQLVDSIRYTVGQRLSAATLDKVVRNTASSWTQSGHLNGRSRKFRKKITPTPANTVFALLLGYLGGKRGVSLFDSIWTQVLDSSAEELIALAADARRLGFLDMIRSGGVIEVAFSRFLGSNERW